MTARDWLVVCLASGALVALFYAIGHHWIDEEIRHDVAWWRRRRQREAARAGYERSDRDDATEADLWSYPEALAAADLAPGVPVRFPTRRAQMLWAPEECGPNVHIARSPIRTGWARHGSDEYARSSAEGRHRAGADTASRDRARVEQTQIWGPDTIGFAAVIADEYGHQLAGRGPDEGSLTRYELTDGGWEQTALTLDVAP